MNTSSFFIAVFIVLALMSWQPQTPPSSAKNHTDVVQSPSATPLPNSSNEDVQKQIAELKRKIDKPPKDIWDKISALAPLLSGIAVALIGFYATNVYNRRQKATEEHRKDQEVLIAQIQTVEKFIPHLSSQSEQTKGAALIAIAALGNEELAVRLARAFQGPGATSALTTIASTGSPRAAETAERALFDILKRLRPHVVTIHERGEHRANGFVIANDGSIVTTAHAIDSLSSAEIMVRRPDFTLVHASVVKVDRSRDLALLKAVSTEFMAPLDLTPSTPRVGDLVSALRFDADGIMHVQTGEVLGIEVDSEGSVSRISIRLPVKHGASGTPVLGQEGRLLGLVHASDLKGMTLLIPTDQILAFVNPDGNEQSTGPVGSVRTS